MKKRTGFLFVLLSLTLCLVNTQQTDVARAEAKTIVTITADGSVSGLYASYINRNGDVYTLTGDIYCELVVEKDNIVVDGAGYSIQGPYIGINLTRRTNVTIRNVQIKTELDQYGYAFGVVLTYSYSNTILNNEITAPYNPIGEARVICCISLENSLNNIISNNTITSIKDRGLQLSSSSGNTISNNKFNGCGFAAYDSAQNTVVNNTVNDKPLVYLERVSDHVVDDAGQVTLVNCNNITVRNLVLPVIGIQLLGTKNSEITNNEADISLENSASNIVSGNTGIIKLLNSTNNNIFGNNWWIDFFRSSNNIVSGNTGGIKTSYCSNISIVGNNLDSIWLQNSGGFLISGNSITGKEGISLGFSANNTIYNNTIAKNYWGFYIRYSPYNIIYANNIIDNKVQVANMGSSNTWDNGSIGNYWSDYNGTDNNSDGIGDTPYMIHDSYGIVADDQDRYPLMMPFGTFSIDTTMPSISILSPENKTYDTTDIPLNFTVSESASWIGYSLDKQANVTIAGNTTLAGLAQGSHSLIVYAKDAAGNIGASGTIYFSIAQLSEPFPTTWTAAATAIAATGGAAFAVYYFTRIRKTTRKTKH